MKIKFTIKKKSRVIYIQLNQTVTIQLILMILGKKETKITIKTIKFKVVLDFMIIQVSIKALAQKFQ